MPKRTISTAAVWVSGCEAKRILNVKNWYALHKLVMLDAVRTLAEPGCPLRYNAADCAKHRRERPVTPSRSQPIGA